MIGSSMTPTIEHFHGRMLCRAGQIVGPTSQTRYEIRDSRLEIRDSRYEDPILKSRISSLQSPISLSLFLPEQPRGYRSGSEGDEAVAEECEVAALAELIGVAPGRYQAADAHELFRVGHGPADQVHEDVRRIDTDQW